MLLGLKLYVWGRFTVLTSRRGDLFHVSIVAVGVKGLMGASSIGLCGL